MVNSEEILSALNESQRKAVEWCDTSSLVIAGAGSGKTRVLTYKIAYLLNQGYEPWSILALTFTNKAADEMKARIAKLVGDERVDYLWMGTFHSVFLRILRYEHECFGYSSNFTIYDAADSKNLIKAIIKELQLDDKVYKPGTIQSRISNAKNQLVTSKAYVANKENYLADERSKVPLLGKIFAQYDTRCRQSQALDFDDILLYTYYVFLKFPDILQKYASRFRYILVDEYQDTNFAQHQIVRQLATVHQRVCVVGDDAQSIYSFRGANIDNILLFNQQFADSKIFKLEQNYRSTQTIVEAANSLIDKNRGQIPKHVFSEKDRGERIKVIEAYSDVEESDIVVKKIKELHQREKTDFSDFAILYRTNAQSRVFEEKLRKQGYPYRIYGGLSFYQHKEIKDIIAYFRIVVNPNDEEAFKRVVNYPARGIGNTSVQKIVEAASLHHVSLWTVVKQPLQYGLNVNRGTLTKIESFCQLIEEFRQGVSTERADKLGVDIIKRSGISQDIYGDVSLEGKARQANVEELTNGLTEFCEGRLEEGNEHVFLTDYLSEVSLMSDLDSDTRGRKRGEQTKGHIALMTIHSAKGLEFNTVFVVGLEENLFPSAMSNESMREMEEERRLFYVAITRAECHCYLTYAKSRLRYGKMEFGNPSRFIFDIDPRFLDMHTSGRSQRGLDELDVPWASNKRGGFGSRRNMWQDEFEETDNMFVQKNDKTRTKAFRPSQPPSEPKKVAPLAPPAGFKKVEDSRASSSIHADIAVGKHIEHERFGLGLVEKLEGTGDNMKATVVFQNAGKKQLLLKFARFKLID